MVEEIEALNVEKTFGPQFKTTSKGKDFVTFDHIPTGAHIHIVRDFPWKRYKICVWKDITHTCGKAKSLEEAIKKIKELDIERAIK